MNIAKPGLARHRERRLEVSVLLSREPDNNVRGDRRPVQSGSNAARRFKEVLDGVLPVHLAEDVDAAGLKREMQVRHADLA